jgi:hypothetical protein
MACRQGNRVKEMRAKASAYFICINHGAATQFELAFTQDRCMGPVIPVCFRKALNK